MCITSCASKSTCLQTIIDVSITRHRLLKSLIQLSLKKKSLHKWVIFVCVNCVRCYSHVWQCWLTVSRMELCVLYVLFCVVSVLCVVFLCVYVIQCAFSHNCFTQTLRHKVTLSTEYIVSHCLQSHCVHNMCSLNKTLHSQLIATSQ